MPLTTNAVILFQGDSITDCGRSRPDQDQPNCGPALGYGYANLAASALLADFPAKNMKIFNRGISGNRMPDLYARIREDILNLKPSLLSILIGVNDTWHHFGSNRGVAVDKYTRLYRTFLEEVRTELPQIQFVICEPFVLKCGVVQEAWLTEMNQRRVAARQIASDFRAVFVPFQQILTDAAQSAPPEYFLYDGVHPTPAGHQLIARAWLKAVAPLI